MSDSEYRVVGTSVRRPDLVEKVTGAAEYAVDVSAPGMLHAKAVRADRAHARIRDIDTAEARSQPDVIAVITADDLGSLFPRFGHIHCDHWILAKGKVRHYGEPVALVIAKTRAAASDAVDMVRVAYEELPALISTTDALDPEAPTVHEEAYAVPHRDLYAHIDSAARSTATVTEEPAAEPQGDRQPSNIAHRVTLEWGDAEAALSDAAVVVEGETHFPMLYPYAMEPYNALATFAGDGLTVVTSAQHPFMVRNDLARIFSLPLSKVRVTVPYVGGGYGSKTYSKVEPLAAVASWATGRPVRLVLDVEESIYTGRQDSATVHVRSGFDGEGHILARCFDIVLNSGAYADSSPLVLTKAVHRCFGPYRVPNLKVVGTSVYTNTAPGVAYRGFGASLGNLAGETNLDQAAEQLGVDALKIRLVNLVPKGEELLPGKRGVDADMAADLRMVSDSIDRDRKHHANYGIGIGCTASDAGDVPVSTAQVRLQFDGSVMLLSGSTEIGQGSRSVLAQIVAEELGVEHRLVRVAQSDTGISPYERSTGASRTTTTVGLAVKRACEDVRSRLRDMAAEVLGCTTEEIDVMGAEVRGPDGTGMPFQDVVQKWFGGAVGEAIGIGIVRREGLTEQMPTFWEVGMVGVGLEIDRETGHIDVDQLVTVADVGRAISPKAVEAQDLGAATQGLGGALYEELIYDGPQLVNANVVDYRVPRVSDMPKKIHSMIAERGDGVGPYGAKGVGEGSLNPMGGAVAAAVARVAGRWPTRLPLTPERVWRLSNGLPEED